MLLVLGNIFEMTRFFLKHPVEPWLTCPATLAGGYIFASGGKYLVYLKSSNSVSDHKIVDFITMHKIFVIISS